MNRRDFIYQIAILAAIGALAAFLYSIAQANLARLGVDSGFDFLWRRAGFEIGQKLIPFDANSTIARAFTVALLNTLVLAGCAIVLSSILGTLIGIARLSPNWLASRMATVYVEVFRNIPALLQIFFWYFVVLRSLPRSRDTLSFMDALFLNNRGLFMPGPEPGGQSIVILLTAIFAGIVLSLFLVRWNR
ncbi:MAG: ABC transporter permease subunit, partial [Gammaproteobacteria bacterium]